MTTTPAVAPLSAEELDKLEAIVRRAYLANEVVAMISPGKMFDLIAQARAATVASVEDARDTARLDWLNEQTVDVIYLDDGTLIDVRGLDARKAIDAAMQASKGATDGAVGDAE